MDELNDMSYQDMQELIALGVIPEEMAENSRQRETAEQLRYGAGPEGRNAGRGVYVAASPLEHLANALQRRKGKKDMNSLGMDRAKMIDQMKRGRSTFGNLLRGEGGLSGVDPRGMQGPAVTPPQNFPMPSVPQMGGGGGGGMRPPPGINPNAPPPGSGGGGSFGAPAPQPMGRMNMAPGFPSQNGNPVQPGVVPMQDMVKKQAMLAQLLRQRQGG